MEEKRRSSFRRFRTRIAIAALPAALGLGVAAPAAQAFHVDSYYDDGYYRRAPLKSYDPGYGLYGPGYPTTTSPQFDLYRIVDEYLDHRYGEDDHYYYDDHHRGHHDGHHDGGHHDDGGDHTVVIIEDSEFDL